jgi:hypothetical protein
LRIGITRKRMILRRFRTMMIISVEYVVLVTTKADFGLAVMLARGGSMVDV